MFRLAPASCSALLLARLALAAQAPANDNRNAPPTPATDHPRHSKHHRSATGEIGSGAGNIGVGAAKGAGSLATGTAKSAANLATLHPIDAAASLGRGAGNAGKDVAVGTVKGTAKITAGVGRAIGKIF